MHEFKERIDEILWLQKKHHNIIDSTDNPSVQQTSLAELHRLNITLSNYFDVAPDIISSFPYKHELSNDVHNFIIQHDMGRNFSFLIKELYRYKLEEMFERKSDFTITDNTVVVRFSSSSER